MNSVVRPFGWRSFSLSTDSTSDLPIPINQPTTDAKDGNWEGAQSVMSRLLERGVPPNVTTFNSLIKAFSKDGCVCARARACVCVFVCMDACVLWLRAFLPRVVACWRAGVLACLWALRWVGRYIEAADRLTPPSTHY